MVQHVVEHAAQGVLGVAMGGGVFHGFGDGQPQRTGAVRIAFEHGPAGLGAIGGRGKDFAAVGVDKDAPIRLLVVAHLHHVDRAFHVQHGAGKGQRRAPLAGSGFGSQPAHALGLVVEGLGDGGVGLVGTGRRDGLVFIVDLAFDPEGLFQALGPNQGRGTVEAVDVQDRLGNGQPTLGRHFLLDDGLGKDDLQLFRGHGFLGLGIEGRGQGRGQIRQGVVPLRRHLRFGQIDLHLHAILHLTSIFAPRSARAALYKKRQSRHLGLFYLTMDSLSCQFQNRNVNAPRPQALFGENPIKQRRSIDAKDSALPGLLPTRHGRGQSQRGHRSQNGR